MASSEFKRAFFSHCRGIRKFLLCLPLCRSIFEKHCAALSTTVIPDHSDTIEQRLEKTSEHARFIDATSSHVVSRSVGEDSETALNLIVYVKSEDNISLNKQTLV
uniref:Uncharacterized protein n=1 Tax=Rhabditophanes sp. KR3021 TaxID=114890 RepID=A0AC35TXH8_9BILA